MTASAEGQHVFAIGFGERLAVDAPKVAKEIIASIGGRGGGSGRVFQGKAPSWDGLAKGVELIEQATGRE